MSSILSGVDWVELHEPFNNQPVFISLSTGITSEKRPLNVDIKDAYDFDWWELLDSKSNRFYYFNTNNKQTTWIKPQSNSIIPFGNVQINSKDKFQSPISSMLQSDMNTEFMKSQKILHYGTTTRNNDMKSIPKRPRSPIVHSMSTDATPVSTASESPSLGNRESPVDELSEKVESHCRISDNGLATQDIPSDIQGGLSSTPSIKHRPFPRTNPRSVPRRGGGAESPITQSQVSVSKTSGGLSIKGISHKSILVRRRLGYSELPPDDASQVSITMSQGSQPVSSSGNKLLSSQQRCQSRGSLSSAGTESTMNTAGLMSVQGQLYRPGRNTGVDIQGQELAIETGMNMNNGGIHSGLSPPNPVNGFPVYDYPPNSNNYYMTHQNFMMMQQQGGMTGRITSQNIGSQPETFCLRRPQSEQAISADINKQRMTMVSPRSDILPGIVQPNRYYPTSSGWVERSLSPTPIGSMIPQYTGPLPGWNSELFRKDQPATKLLNWCKDSIQKPLLVSTDKILKSEACQSFKQIQGYMGDRKSKHSPSELVNSIMQKGLNYYPLRDEIFMQICKQTTNNPDDLSTLRGWELLRTCLSYFAPSPMFRPYLEGYVLRHLDNSHSNEFPTPQQIQQAADKTLQILSHQNNTTIRMDSNIQYQYQQQQQMMMMANMQTMSGQKNHLPLHLFESGDNSDDSASQRCLPLNSHFGYTLDEIMRAQYLRFPERELPWILVTLCEEIWNRNGQQTEGIFRISADSSAVQAMCTVVDLCDNLSDNQLTSGEHSPHTPACCVKRWLDSLLEPLVPPSLCSVSQAGRARSPLEVYQCLTRLHQVTLMYLVRFLQLLSLDDNVRLNRMGPWNLAVALAPNVFQLDPGSSEYGGSRSSKRAGGSSGLDTCRSDNSANDSSGSSSRGGTTSADDSFRPHVNFLYQLIVGLDTTPLDGVI